MTEKFKLVKSEPHIENIETGECYDLDSDNFSYIVKIMNDLSNENERLQTHLSQLTKNNREGIKKIQSLAKENEKLKNKIDVLENDN